MSGKKKRFIFNEDPKQRMIYLWIGGVLVTSIIGGIYFFGAAQKNNVEVGGARVVGAPSSVSVTPGVVLDPMYKEKIEYDNQQRAEEALSQNQSYLPIIVGNNNVASQSPLDFIPPVEETKVVLPTPEVKIEEVEPEQPQIVEKIVEVEVEVIPVSDRVIEYVQPTKARFTHEDFFIMNALINIQENKTPNGEFDYARSVNRNNQNQAREVAVSANQPVVNNVNSGSENKSIMLKTGDILHAVLETAVNSKEPSPIMAKIVTGDLKGTRLVGSIGVSGKKVVLQFNRANVPGLNKSLNISAVAIDPETSRTAMASEVNNHYFAKYGLLVASTFLSGWAEAVSNSNTQTVVGPLGNVIVTPKDKVSNSDIMKESLGKVGDGLSREAERNMSSLTPTIKVDSGVAIGILIMNDVEVGL